ncbi:Cellulase (glycosyl hydrolase family 5) [Hymenobacter gelipurpurascens]|uniref:Cellulase (Glycosyl hydrolase family 5) n=1 Tax=Hymenobacter gelipurpurascens TaxID=89968 RepID=A0A212TIT1_9BACT|nr:cellulase family glycosylhydrolase [Hymenobacter gelipurpurascens]SNC65932.1 Cellulase (glycosyl hydrolase family 5) [Hymenobacter gelipurpurascens]
MYSSLSYSAKSGLGRVWLISLLFLSLGLSSTSAQTSPPAKADVYIDGKGIMRWQGSKQEVALFGVNYTTPFAYSYRAHQKLGINPEQGIAQDVYHLSRLGVDAFRVHVWDVEVTDTVGNLLQNEHLRLLDYLIQQLKARRIKIILTPIAYWGNGYPEKDTAQTGFSSIYPKGQAYNTPRAVKAQENYLTQFLNHRNQYTGQFNREDPDIIAYEVCNEPHYRQPEAEVSAFIQRMVQAMRATGYKKPIFYNIAESPTVSNAILSSQVQGFTFQWYPSALVGGHTLRGNMLPLVNQYPIPYAKDPRFSSKPRMVYEFESADILQPVMYPLMARSFRSAGMQWATQFAYDPLAIAFANTEYQTHYLNLAYTPAKAVSLLIAGKVFRQVKRGQPFGTYPTDSVFNNFRVSYRAGVSELNAPEEFYYTSSTTTQPRKPASLRHVAGTGSSPIVAYEGTGAYFLDRLATGVWRLEVMPDALQVRDPFATTSLKQVVTRIAWNTQPIRMSLPGLGQDFTVRGLNTGNTFQGQATNGTVRLQPGVYVVAARGKNTSAFTPSMAMGAIKLGEYVAPPATNLPTQILHTAPFQIAAGQPATLQATVAGADATDSIFLVAQHYYGRTRTLPMRRLTLTTAESTVPADLLYPGLLRYWMVVKHNNKNTTFPGAHPGSPRDWDYAPREYWEASIVAPGTALPLYIASQDQQRTETGGINGAGWSDYVTTGNGQLSLRLLQSPPPSSPIPFSDAAAPVAFLRAYFGDRLASRAADAGTFQELVIRGRRGAGAGSVRLVLTTRDAVAYVADVELPADMQEVRVPLTAFRLGAQALLPRPYPSFLPLTFQTNGPATLPLAQAEVLQVLLGPAATPATEARPFLDIESIYLR